MPQKDLQENKRRQWDWKCSPKVGILPCHGQLYAEKT
jgi:hypothetical protein